MDFFVPANFDVDLLLRSNPPSVKAIRRDKLLYIVHLVVYLPAVKKELRHQTGYVNLSSELLIKTISNTYLRHIEYLCEIGVLEVNNRYSNRKHFSKSYRLAEDYRTSSIVVVKLKDTDVSLEIRKNKSGSSKAELVTLNRDFFHLVRHFDGLKFNAEAANKYIGKIMYEDSLQNGISRVEYFSDRLREIRINNMLLSRKEYNLKIDSTAGRLHSTITRMKKEFRHFLTYKGEPLVGLDLKASQPFLAQLLLTTRFWEPVRRRNDHSHPICLSDLSGRLKHEDWKLLSGWASGAGGMISPMSYIKGLGVDNESVMVYQKLVNTEDIYSSLLNDLHILVRSNDEFKRLYKADAFPLTRTHLKILVMRGMYASPHSKKPINQLAQKLFNNRFPSVNVMFKAVKKVIPGKHEMLAILLQAIEAELILTRVCKSIVGKTPKIPFFTIHDSVLTVPRYETVVQEVIENLIEKNIGYKPRVTREDYSINALNQKPVILLDDLSQDNDINELAF